MKIIVSRSFGDKLVQYIALEHGSLSDCNSSGHPTSTRPEESTMYQNHHPAGRPGNTTKIHRHFDTILNCCQKTNAQYSAPVGVWAHFELSIGQRTEDKLPMTRRASHAFGAKR